MLYDSVEIKAIRDNMRALDVYSNAELKMIICLLDSGVSLEEVLAANIYGNINNVVYSAIEELKLLPSKIGDIVGLSSDKICEIANNSRDKIDNDLAKMFIEGMTLNQISDVTGLDYDTVRDKLIKFDLYKPKLEYESDISYELLKRLHVDERKSANEISKMLGQKDTYIRKLLRDYGIYKRLRSAESSTDRLHTDVSKYLDSILDMYMGKSMSAKSIASELQLNYMDVLGVINQFKDSQFKDRVITLHYRDGYNPYEISQELGLGINIVRRYIRKNNLNSIKNDRLQPSLKENKDKIIDMYVNKKKKVTEIADELGFNYNSVAYVIYEYKLVHGEVKHRDKLDKDKIIDMYVNEKKKAKEIADELGFNYGSVKNVILEYKHKHEGSAGNHRLNRVKIIDMYVNEKKKAKEIAIKLGYNYGSVKSVIQDYKRRYKESEDKIVSMYEKGLTILEIADKLNLNYGSVWDLINSLEE